MMNGDFGARHRREPAAAAWDRTAGAWQETGGFYGAASVADARPAPAAAPPGGAGGYGGCRDRTGEFRAVVTQMRGGVAARGGRRGVVGAPPAPPSSSTAAGFAKRRFAQHARHIGADLARTGAKLEKLALLARGHQQQRGPEVAQLAQIVGQDFGALNHAIAALQEAVRSVAGVGGGSVGQQAAHSSAVVLVLQTRLAEMSGRYRDIVEPQGRQQQHQQQHQQHQHQQQQRFDPAAAADSMHRSQSDVSIDMSAAASHQQQGQLERSDRYLSERDDTMRTIEQTMVDLGSVFQQLATIVKEQDELVQRIDASVEDTTLNVEGAHAEMLKFFKSLSSNRRLMLKVFGLLIVFFVLFVVFLR